jgi:hypothetical protein
MKCHICGSTEAKLDPDRDPVDARVCVDISSGWVCCPNGHSEYRSFSRQEFKYLLEGNMFKRPVLEDE